MNRQKIEKIVEDLNNYYKSVRNYHEFQTALVMWWRYGDTMGLTDEQLERVDRAIDSNETILDEYLREQLDEIVDEV